MIYILLIILIILLIYNKNNEKFTNINNIELVVSRYNENLEWLNEEPFNKYPVICYNKGINDNFKINNEHKIIKLRNVGRCDHTYLYHIINNYDNLADITIFLPGSNNMDKKKHQSRILIEEIEKTNNTVFVGVEYNNVKNDLYNFEKDHHIASSGDNVIINSEEVLTKANIRPFGKWYEHHFKNININCVSYYSILGIHKKHILQHPKEFYENLIKELEVSSNPEVGHYFERSWNAIFYSPSDVSYIYYGIGYYWY
jgi:hypothetical protein